MSAPDIWFYAILIGLIPCAVFGTKSIYKGTPATTFFGVALMGGGLVVACWLGVLFAEY